jgi:hypothetical protein
MKVKHALLSLDQLMTGEFHLFSGDERKFLNDLILLHIPMK